LCPAKTEDYCYTVNYYCDSKILHDFLLSEEQKAEEIEDDTAFAEFCMNIHAL